MQLEIERNSRVVYFLNRCLKLSSFSIVLLALIFLNPDIGNANTGKIPNGWESYLERPDILSVPSRDQNLDLEWQKLKDAHFSFVAEILEFYPPDTHIYFLARDSEHLFDVAKLVTQNTEDESRLHLLNISRGNMRAQGIKEYLSENGISEDSLRQGKKIVFVDTGFSGTIPRAIQENFTEESKKKIRTHLVVSSTADHPSSRLFLVEINPSVIESAPAKMHGTIISYEHMPRYTDRSTRFVDVDGKHHPISPIVPNGMSDDGQVSKEKSLKFMMDLRAEWDKSSRKSDFKSLRKYFRKIKLLLLDNSVPSTEKLKNELARLKGSAKGRLLEAAVRDFVEMKTNLDVPTSMLLSDLGLRPVFNQGNFSSKKNELIVMYPEWAPYLEDPETKIPELFQQKKWQMIGSFIDADIDKEINEILIKNLFDSPGIGIKQELQILMIQKGDHWRHHYLIKNVFSQPKAIEMLELIEKIIELHKTNEVLGALVHSFFSKPYAKNATKIFQKLIEKANGNTLFSISQNVFSNPDLMVSEDTVLLYIRRAIETKNIFGLEGLIYNFFSKPHSKNMLKALQMLVENTPFNSELKWNLLKKVFSQPHMQSSIHQILASSLEITDLEERKVWIQNRLPKLASKLKCSTIFK